MEIIIAIQFTIIFVLYFNWKSKKLKLKVIQETIKDIKNDLHFWQEYAKSLEVLGKDTTNG